MTGMPKIVRRLCCLLLLIGIFLLFFLAVLMQPVMPVSLQDVPEVNEKRLREHVRRLTEDFYPRSFDTPENLQQAAVYIENEFRQAGANVELQKFIVDGEIYFNVIAHFGPQNGPLTIVGAHYDSYVDSLMIPSSRKGYDPHTHTPGADDNASGVAGLLELARLFKMFPPEKGIDLVAYALEEPPNFKTEKMGSAVHAKMLKQSGRVVKMMIALEMIGYFNDEPGSQGYPVPFLKWIYPDTGNFIAVIGRLDDIPETRKIKAVMQGATDLPVYSINAIRAIPGLDFSDHQSFWNEDFPALMVTDTAFYRNLAYHQAGDTVDSLDYEKMTKVVQSVWLAINLP